MNALGHGAEISNLHQHFRTDTKYISDMHALDGLNVEYIVLQNKKFRHQRTAGVKEKLRILKKNWKYIYIYYILIVYLYSPDNCSSILNMDWFAMSLSHSTPTASLTFSTSIACINAEPIPLPLSLKTTSLLLTISTGRKNLSGRSLEILDGLAPLKN